MSDNVGSRRPGSGSNSDSDSLSALLSSSWSDPNGKDMFAGSTSIRAVSLSLSVSGSGWLCLVRRRAPHPYRFLRFTVRYGTGRNRNVWLS